MAFSISRWASFCCPRCPVASTLCCVLVICVRSFKLCMNQNVFALSRPADISLGLGLVLFLDLLPCCLAAFCQSNVITQNCTFCTKFHFSVPYSTGHGYCSTYTRVKCVQYGGFTRNLLAEYARVKFYTHCRMHTNYTQILRVFYGRMNLLLFIHVKCAYFFSEVIGYVLRSIHERNITLSGAGFAQRVVKAIKMYFQMRVIFAWKLDAC